MKPNTIGTLLVYLALTGLTACSPKQAVTDPVEENPLKKMAEKALAECGKGNVHQVTTESFSCKESPIGK
jgi:hypothetical protein